MTCTPTQGGHAGTIFAFNEIRFNDPLTYVDPSGATTPADLVPPSLRIAADGTVRTPSQIYSNIGISRHNSAGNCQWRASHSAYECRAGMHRQLIVEDLTHESMASHGFRTRRMTLLETKGRYPFLSG